MSIVSSTYVLDSFAQSDGRIYCTETHIDHLGNVYKANYLSEADMDHDAIAIARGIRIADELAAAEAEAIINGD